MEIWPSKGPGEVKDYTVNWTRQLYNSDELAQYNAAVAADPSKDLPTLPETVIVPADRIATSTFTLPPGATLVATSTSNTQFETKIRLSGGDEGATCEIVNNIVAVSGQDYNRTIKLKVKTK